ncbi:MAG TPA: hypothetical protein VGM69_18635 [Chloroflexota bacterium]|jgi:hypothetical protein
MAMIARWRSRDIALAIPERVLRSMWERARRSFGIDQGGRYDARSGTTLLLWSGPLTSPGAHPIAAVSVHWQTPSPDRAIIHRVAWTADRSAREVQVWRAIEVLAGVDWPLIQSALALSEARTEAA